MQIPIMMRIILLLFTISRPVSSTIILTDFQQQALAEHNYFRQLHCTGPLKLNSTLNNIAQSYAEYLATNRIFNHSGRAGLGENLWATFSSGVINTVNVPTNTWYNEISFYSYSSPGYSSSTGHFTQVIWKNSTQLGIGIAFTSDSKSAYVVANYYPAGNLLDKFPNNVLPFCSTTAAATSTVKTTTAPTTSKSTTKKTTITTIKTTTKRRQRRAIIESYNQMLA